MQNIRLNLILKVRNKATILYMDPGAIGPTVVQEPLGCEREQVGV